jgi:ammonium transporter Rh
VICNTNLSIAAGCVAAAFMSRIYHGKLEMTIVMNATLAGGVAIGTPSDLVSSPATAMWIGFIAGSWSAFGFEKLGPYLAEKINLQDTCGVNSLHGMPGIIGGLSSAFVLFSWNATSWDSTFGKQYLTKSPSDQATS